jgi:hypothetical protein
MGMITHLIVMKIWEKVAYRTNKNLFRMKESIY